MSYEHHTGDVYILWVYMQHLCNIVYEVSTAELGDFWCAEHVSMHVMHVCGHRIGDVYMIWVYMQYLYNTVYEVSTAELGDFYMYFTLYTHM